jgi:hypothetical protein
LPTGDRSATQVVSLQTLRSLLEEIAPADAMSNLLLTGTAAFEYTRGPRPVRCTARSEQAHLKLVIAVPDEIEKLLDPERPVAVGLPPPSCRRTSR